MCRANSLSENSWVEGAKVLIVDSDTRNVHEIARALRYEGFVAFEATSFADAKRLWVTESPHVLVADVCLGQFNGLQLLMQARDDRPDLSAIITCAFADVVLEAETRRFGGTFMVKPLEPRQILAAIGAPVRQAIHAPAFPDRRRDDRRKGTNQEFVHDRRVRERRTVNQSLNRRGDDRRQRVIVNFSPERRTGERRANRQDGSPTA